MKGMEMQEFKCTWCSRVIKARFTPGTTPSCPSCGSETAADGRGRTGFCATCHGQYPLYETRQCPLCGAEAAGFTGNVPQEYSAKVGSTPPVIRQGPSGGARRRRQPR